MDHVLPGHPRVTLLRCAACGVAFLEDLTPPDYEIHLAVQLDYYVEQGAGIDCIVAPLLRLPPEPVRRFLDVGCSFGFALDFSRFAFGWEVLGVDPSPLAAAGAAALDVPVRRSYFSAGLDLGPEPFDLVLCSEILEHLAQPLTLLVAMRERLSPDGLLVLSTPNLAVVRRETEQGVLGRALSPGLHVMIYDRGALSLLLAKAGFSDVRIEESPETLRAFAACSPPALERMRPADPDRSILRDYFGARAASAPPDSSLACGFAWRHFKECVNAGLHEEAAASRAVLARIYQARFGLDLEKPAELARLEGPRPFNLAGALYFSGILELNGLRRPDRAAEYFAAAVAAGSALLEEQRPSGLCDGETEAFMELGRKHLPMAIAAIPAIDRDRPRAEAPVYPVPDRSFVRAVKRLFRRPRPGRLRPDRIIIAERFVAGCARLASVVLPLDVIAQQPAARLRLAIFAEGSADARAATLVNPRLSPEEALRLVFAPFDSSAGATFFLGVVDGGIGSGIGSDIGSDTADLQAIRAAAAGRPPIALECRGEDAADLVPGDRGISVFREVLHSDRSELRAAPAPEPVPQPEIPTAYWIDAFWCDPHGIYFRGWAHAHEHRVRALRIESAGRSARVETFSDRPDLLAHYPDHEHVRHGGFAIYLACPPGHPVIMTLETDGGATSFPLPLPEGPLPAWPELPRGENGVSPMMRRFAGLLNGGRMLQIGARTPRGEEAVPSRRLLKGRVIGLDIHPGPNVDVVGDAHGLSRFLREGSVDAVLSAAVLEHLQAPWLLAAEINRVLKPGGLVYHQVPGAWPAHAQPNDFWRISAEGLRVLFGPESGFEVLEACDSGPAAIIPGPDWRKEYLDMPTVPAYAVAEILSRKVADLQPGAVAWPLGSGASEVRSRQYPVSGLRPASPRGGS
ncbi:MAG TPA: methyltransferase domain-containing protein [Thermoanaerobaculia bacterium]|nr:methyltransferase domain-containing protein [Thermoanaerobaculia bacterium]